MFIKFGIYKDYIVSISNYLTLLEMLFFKNKLLTHLKINEGFITSLFFFSFTLWCKRDYQNHTY